MKKLNKSQGKNKEVDLDNLPLYDCIQEQEDDWVSSVLGSNTDAFRAVSYTHLRAHET